MLKGFERMEGQFSEPSFRLYSSHHELWSQLPMCKPRNSYHPSRIQHPLKRLFNKVWTSQRLLRKWPRTVCFARPFNLYCNLLKILVYIILIQYELDIKWLVFLPEIENVSPFLKNNNINNHIFICKYLVQIIVYWYFQMLRIVSVHAFW